MTFQLKFRLLVVSAAACGLLLAACGGDEDGATVGTVPPVSSSTSQVAAPTTTTTTVVVATSTTITPDLVGEPAFSGSSSVSTVGIDVVTFGMTLNQAEAALSASFVPVADGGGECFVVRPEGGPLGVELTVTGGTIERVDLTNETITTRSGAGVGMSEQGLNDLFGDRLSTQPRGDGGNTVTFTPADASDAEFRVIFETDGSVVTSFRSGRIPQVTPMVPCQ